MKSSVIPKDSDYPPAMEIQPSGRVESLSSSEESPHTIPPHPLGVKPLGNQFTATRISRNSIGLFQIIPDELLTVVLDFLDSYQLCLLGSTCKFLYAFSRSDDLWKTLFIESPVSESGAFTWRGTWRSTLLGLSPDDESNISCDDVFSDVLYSPFQCTYIPLHPYAAKIPRANAITRLPNLTPSEFSENWSDKPFILTDPVREWPVYQTWDTASLLDKYGNTKFRAEAVDWTLKNYIEYMNNNSDESPLYLFDRSFVSKMQLQVGRSRPSPSYWIPECFGEDLFAVLGDDRPDDKWLIIGPARSGSTYHKDPNATSAWNAVLKGSKYWIMFPSTPSSPNPPGVFVSDDQSEVTSPISITEWLQHFHAEARKTPGCLEGVCGEGEVLHVPSGWWHLVVNLEPSIAITQNFVPRAHLSKVLEFMREKPEQISGFRKIVVDPYGRFVELMRAEHGEVLEGAFAEMERKAEGRKRKWDNVAGHGEESGGFSFGFGDDSDADVP